MVRPSRLTHLAPLCRRRLIWSPAAGLRQSWKRDWVIRLDLPAGLGCHQQNCPDPSPECARRLEAEDGAFEIENRPDNALPQDLEAFRADDGAELRLAQLQSIVW